MPFSRFLLGLAALALLGGCIGVRQRLAPPPQITVITASAADEIVASYSQDAGSGAAWAARFDITSPTGIGSGQLSLEAGEWPDPLLLRLHLAGLEEFKLAAGESLLQLSVSSGPERTVRQVDAAGQELSPDHPYWLDVSFGEGYFDLLVPPALLLPDVETLALSWIDFYR